MIGALVALAATLGGGADTLRFQQGVDYRIEAALDESADVLRGRARLRYTNRSPVPLDTLWFHQHLNAFRPNSAWALRELRSGERRFQELGPQEHAFERFTRVEVGGVEVAPVYPGAPDSTVAAIPLPIPLAPGETAIVRMDWDARLSTVPRRQGRQGRQYDFAHWYPRIAVFEDSGWQTQALLPQGEFYGEFGSYDVTLEVAADQVIGSTGVPVEGDPGWTLNGRGPAPAAYQRDFYGTAGADPLGLLPTTMEGARKRVRWRADDVHHFAWSINPEYIYEGGLAPRTGEGAESGVVPIHVLYQPGDTAWDDGVAVRRTAETLAWMQRFFGPYLWPQITNLHRVERGGTEFPMVMMNGSASIGVIAEELGHQYLHGMLANNEFREGWLDEGVINYVVYWYEQESGVGGIDTLWTRDLEVVRSYDRAGRSEPVARPGSLFADINTYNAMTYVKGRLVMRMLHEMLGPETMRAIFREYYRRYALKHVTESDFRAVVEEVSGQELDWFFDQWLHTTKVLDYGILSARTARQSDGRWRTRVVVRRRGDAWMPVSLRVGEAMRTLSSQERVQEVEVITDGRPAEAVLDPEEVLIDLVPANNRARL